VKIKICGITNLEDAIMCIESGADFLGFNFYKGSSRYIDFDECKKISKIVKKSYPEIILVGVFVNSPIIEIEKNLNECSLEMGQLCGDEPVDYFYELGDKVFKAFRPVDKLEMDEQLNNFPIRKESPSLLIDSFRKGFFGGSGERANWMIASELASKFDILLAGGLTPENIQNAINRVKPWGVDVASGVESIPGKKDRTKVINLISNVRAL
jgi:phosphoribosylanthranilate isomerase